MDFLGIGRRTIAKGSHSHTDPRMNSEHKKSMHYLSRVTPQMIQKVLAFRGFCEEIMPSCSPPASLHHPLPATSRSSIAHEESSTQLTVFYNGTVNVYEVSANQAQAIMNMLSDNGNPPIQKSGTAGSLNEVPISESEATARGEKGIEKLRRAELPLARKQSLQRFLEKRRERLNSVAPYTACSTSPCKFVEDEAEVPFKRWV